MASLSFKDRFVTLRDEYNDGPKDMHTHMQTIIEGTDAYLKFAKLKARTRDGGEELDGAYADVTLLCPVEGAGCDECFASTKFVEQHAPNVWEFVDNEAPDGEPPQACTCGKLRELSEKDTQDLEKLARLHGLLVVAYESAPK